MTDIQELSTFLHCLHLIKKLNRELLKNSREYAFLPPWTSKPVVQSAIVYKRSKDQKVGQMGRRLEISRSDPHPLLTLETKVEQFNFEVCLTIRCCLFFENPCAVDHGRESSVH